jgi:WD40 repeat protein
MNTIVSIGGNRKKRNEIYLWAIETNKLKHTLIGHDNVIRSIDFSSNDKYLASVGEDNLINLWNAITGKLIATFTEDNNKELTSVIFSYDDKYLITGSQDWTIKYWNVKNLINND